MNDRTSAQRKPNSVSKLAETIKRIGDELGDSEMPLQRALIFLLIAEAGESGMDQTRLAKATGLGTSSISRHIQALGKLNRFRKPGLDVVETRVHQEDWRTKPIFLTAKGIAVVRKLVG